MQIAALSRALTGESRNGDGYLVASLNREMALEHLAVSDQAAGESRAVLGAADLGDCDTALIAVIDGIGHGVEAAAPTQKVMDCIGKNYKLEVSRLVRECHKSAMHSRGATLGIALIEMTRSRIQFIGVGNVEIQVASLETREDNGRPAGLLSRSAGAGVTIHRFVTNKGIVGYNLPAKLLSFSYEYAPGDVMAMYSDGISGKFSIRDISGCENMDAASIAESIVSEFATYTDDATVAVVK